MEEFDMSLIDDHFVLEVSVEEIKRDLLKAQFEPPHNIER
jgi:hypothetical protein